MESLIFNYHYYFLPDFNVILNIMRHIEQILFIFSGGLDEVVLQIRDDGKFQQIPVIFAVGRRQLGFALKKKVPISAIGIINPEGAEVCSQILLVFRLHALSHLALQEDIFFRNCTSACWRNGKQPLSSIRRNATCNQVFGVPLCMNKSPTR